MGGSKTLPKRSPELPETAISPISDDIGPEGPPTGANISPLKRPSGGQTPGQTPGQAESGLHTPENSATGVEFVPQAAAVPPAPDRVQEIFLQLQAVNSRLFAVEAERRREKELAERTAEHLRAEARALQGAAVLACSCLTPPPFRRGGRRPQTRGSEEMLLLSLAPVCFGCRKL